MKSSVRRSLLFFACGAFLLMLVLFRHNSPPSVAPSGPLIERADSISSPSSPDGMSASGLRPARASDPELASRRAIALARAPEVFSRFNNWAERHHAAASTGTLDAATLEQGVALATERRQSLHVLIRTDPRLALDLAVPYAQRRDLPDTITALLRSGSATKAIFTSSPPCRRQQTGAYRILSRFVARPP